LPSEEAYGEPSRSRSTVSTTAAAVFEPLRLGGLELRNRVLRSSVAGRFDNSDGSGTHVRINWDVKLARGGVGAIISSNAPIHERGHIVPGYAYLDSDERIPFFTQFLSPAIGR
jgi:2,4-dienoyl-CoA reductase-like NADH-dependent reductase (Old Yellow Enzyme family)